MQDKTKKQLPKFRFMAMSKLIGLIAFGFAFMITIYAMIEMHNAQEYSNLSQLIISAYAFATVYASFYLLMAKVEHVEEEKTSREKELAMLMQQKDADADEIQRKRQEITDLVNKMNEIIGEPTNTTLY